MPDKQHNHKAKIFRKIGIFILVGAALTVTLIFSLRRLTEALYLERSANTQLLTEQIALNLDESLTKQMDQVEHFVLHFERQNVKTLDDALNMLTFMRETSNEKIVRLYLVDSTSLCHSPNEPVFRWRSTDVLAADEPRCLLSTAESAISSEQMMLFVMPFENRIKLDVCTVTHMIMATTMDVVDKFFDIKYYGQGSSGFILYTNGSQVYRNHNVDTGIKYYNLLTALDESEAEFHYGASAEQLRTDLASRNSGCIHISMNGQAYYLTYEPLEIIDWMAVMLIEEEHIAGASAGFVNSMTASMTLVAVIAVVTIVGAVIAATRSANHRLAAAAKAERAANEAKTRFLSAMSHDIRTPMNAIIGMTNLATNNIDDKEYALDCLSKVKMSSDHLLTLINDILDISKVEAGKMRLNPSEFSLEDEVNRLAEIVRPQIVDKKQTFTCQMHGLENKMVYADKLRLNQVMLNILSNAVKYTPEGGHVELDISGEASGANDDFAVVYRVKDNGIGMSEEFQRTMYDTFSREDNEPKRNIQGSGLGLSICKQMVDLMGGTIECESTAGVGTTFTVIVTLKRREDRAPLQLQDKADEQSSAELVGLRVLVAEDNDINWEITSAVLGMSGILTERAENGQACVDMISNAEEGYYALILMDVQMPIMNGYEATKAIRAAKSSYVNSIPIIAMTADAFAEDIQRCIQMGMNDHVAKPIEVDRLLLLIKRYSLDQK